MNDDLLGTDLRVRFDREGFVDLDLSGGDLARISGADNLVQALMLRLSTPEGELAELGHARYGSRLDRLIGELPDRDNLELLRRYARRALLDEPRVAEVLKIQLLRHESAPGLIELHVRVRAVTGQLIELVTAVDLT